MENKELKELLTGSSTAFESAGVTVHLMNVKSLDEADFSGVDGLLLYNFRDETIVRQLSKKLPVVLLDYTMQGITSVLPDNAGGVRKAVSYLAGMGHSRIAFLWLKSSVRGTRDRYMGYLEGLEEAGLQYSDELVGVHYAAKKTIEEIEEFATLDLRKWFSLANPPTAVVTSGDVYALPLLNRAVEMGIRVPEELSITGFDDTVSCRYSRPSLTSIHQPFKEMGFAAAEALLDEIETHHKITKTILVDTELVIRNSTAPVKPGNPADQGQMR
jgi:LacI family transcriptional regulator